MFTGRLKEIAILEKALFQTKHGNPQHVLITGERGIGKSSLLLYLDAIARGLGDDGKTKFAVMRLEADPEETFQEFVTRVARALAKLDATLHGNKDKAKKLWAFVQRIEAGGFSLGGSSNAASQADFEDLSDSLVEFLGGLATGKCDGLLLVIDEADRAIKSDLGRFAKLLTERMQHSGQNTFVMVLAGLPSVKDALILSHESSLRIFHGIELSPLATSDRVAVVHAGLKEAATKGDPVSITDEALAAIANLSDGYPQFIQQLASSAFDATSDNMIDLGDFDKGLAPAMQELAAKYFKGPVLQEIFSDDYRTVLAALAQDGDRWVTKAEIRERTKLKESQVTNALSTLKQKLLIIPKPGKKGVYRLPSKAFALWVSVAIKVPHLSPAAGTPELK